MDLFLRDSELRFPIPGVEPGPKDGKSPILTARPYRICSYELAFRLCLSAVRRPGIEPGFTDWKSGILPLN